MPAAAAAGLTFPRLWNYVICKGQLTYQKTGKVAAAAPPANA
jgi:hypothetical protein